MSYRPDALQTQWREDVRQIGSIVTGLSQVDIHHVLGRAARIKGVGNIGHWFILPLDHEAHLWIDWGNEGLKKLKGAYVAHNGPKLFYEIEHMTLIEFQIFLFARVCEKVESEIDDDIYNAIIEYHK